MRRLTLPAMSQAGATPPLDDDAPGFADVERAHLRERWLADFEWMTFDAPSPRNRPGMRLAGARVGMVSTAGAHLPGTPPLGAGGRAAIIPVDAAVTFTHPGFDVERAARDPDVVWPVAALARAAADGMVGSVAATAVSTMGGALKGERIQERAAPATVAWARDEQVDLALLVPA